MAVEVGAKVAGKVTGITNFGAFVDLGEGQNGLVHISEVSDRFVKDINEVLKVGDDVTVKVMSIKDNKIGLSIKQTLQQPKRPQPTSRPRGNGYKKNDKPVAKSQNFDDLMSGFLKDSEERLSTLKRNTEGKRGGRGGRRN